MRHHGVRPVVAAGVACLGPGVHPFEPDIAAIGLDVERGDQGFSSVVKPA
jgi:hypothetical protein